MDLGRAVHRQAIGELPQQHMVHRRSSLRWAAQLRSARLRRRVHDDLAAGPARNTSVDARPAPGTLPAPRPGAPTRPCRCDAVRQLSTGTRCSSRRPHLACRCTGSLPRLLRRRARAARARREPSPGVRPNLPRPPALYLRRKLQLILQQALRPSAEAMPLELPDDPAKKATPGPRPASHALPPSALHVTCSRVFGPLI
jgi:hypothetical protein